MSGVTAIIGCGNPNRRDDGAGPAVIRRLRERRAETTYPGVQLLDAGTDGLAVMFAARGCRCLVIVDACRSGAEPGALFEVPGSELEEASRAALITHDFRWDNALYAGRRIYREEFPIDVTVYLVEAESLDLDIGLSPKVAATAERVADLIEARLKDRPCDGRRQP